MQRNLTQQAGRHAAGLPRSGWKSAGSTSTSPARSRSATVDLDISRGEVHGLVGANGAGKSTLIRCLAGVTVPDRGTITIDGAANCRQGSPQASEAAGLAFIHQELNLIPHFSALENMLLGVPKVTRLCLIDWKRSSIAARAAAERVGIEFPARHAGLRAVRRRALAGDDRQGAGPRGQPDRHGRADRVAVRAPRASSSSRSSATWPREGVAILYVSHRLDEVLDLSRPHHRAARRRNRRRSATRGELDKKGLIRAIIGHDVGAGETRADGEASTATARRSSRRARLSRGDRREGRQLRRLSGRGAGAWRPRRRRPHRGCAPGARRRPAARAAISNCDGKRHRQSPTRRMPWPRASRWCRKSGARRA